MSKTNTATGSSPFNGKHTDKHAAERKRIEAMDKQIKMNALQSRGTYRTGDGEARQTLRPGSMDAFELPSLMGDKLHYRSGKVSKK